MKKYKLQIAFLLILIISCQNKHQNFYTFFRKEGIPLYNDTIYLFLPNSSCSFCSNEIISVVNKMKSSKIYIVFLNNEVVSFIDKNALKEIKNIPLYKSEEKIARKYFKFMSKNENLIFTVEYLHDKFFITSYTPQKTEYLINKLKTYEN